MLMISVRMIVSAVGIAASAAALSRQVVAAHEQGTAHEIGGPVRRSVVDRVQQFVQQTAVCAPVQVRVADPDQHQAQPTARRNGKRSVIVQVIGGSGRESDGQDKVQGELMTGMVQPVH